MQFKPTYPAAAHRVHGLDHARSCGHTAGVLLQTVGLLVYCLHLDVGLTQSDPSPTWKQNTANLNAAGRRVFVNQRGPTSMWWRETVGVGFSLVFRKLFGLVMSIYRIILLKKTWKPLQNMQIVSTWRV